MARKCGNILFSLTMVSPSSPPSPTIFALSSGALPAGVAVVRVSGPRVPALLEAFAGQVPPPRQARLAAIRDPRQGVVIDRGLVLFFPAPHSFTGEDVAEFHLHGSRPVIAALFSAFCAFGGLEQAEAGAFTRRAFEHGKLDLTEVEGLADLLVAETEAQRRQALRLAEGAFRHKAEDWRETLIRARAALEADLDFAEEEDVPGSIAENALPDVAHLLAEVRAVLADGRRGERRREGYRVALLGAPNAGKSSLFNALLQREAAIVTARPGTTRDVLEAHLDLEGAAVILTDGAGLREDGADAIEIEGMRRARAAADGADLVLWLQAPNDPPPSPEDLHRFGERLVMVQSKADLDNFRKSVMLTPVEGVFPTALSTKTGQGITALVSALAWRAGAKESDDALISRARQREALERMAAALEDMHAEDPVEIQAEALRRAGHHLGQLTGRIDVEEILGSIFSTFCIGK